MGGASLPAALADVFISYSRRDKEFVARLAEALVAREKDVWVDWEDIPPTADWFAEIAEGIDGADAFVYVISPDSVASEVCAREIAHAEERNKRVIPILRRPVADDLVPAKARAHNWIAFDDDAAFDDAVATLVSALELDLDWAKGHTRWLGTALTWDRSGRDHSHLLRGSELREMEAWLAASAGKSPEPTELQNELLYESRRGAARRQRTIFGAVSIALVVASVLAVVALVQRSEAIDQKQTAQARELDAQAQTAYATDPELSLLLATKAYETKPSPTSLDALTDALTRSKVRVRMELPSKVEHASWSPDGRRVLVAAASGTAEVRDARTSRRLVRVATKTRGGDAVWAPDGRSFATGGQDGTTRIWSADGRPLGMLPGGAHPVFALAWRPDGRALAVSTYEGDGSTDKQGRLTGAGRVRIWEIASRRVIRAIAAPRVVHTLAWNPAGTTLATAQLDGRAELREARTGALIRTLVAPGSDRATEIAVARTAPVLVTGSITFGDDTEVRGVRIWDATTGRAIATAPSSPTTRIAVSDDGRYVAYAGPAGGRVFLNDTGPDGQHEFSRLASTFSRPVQGVAISASGTRVLVNQQGGKMELFDSSDGSLVESLDGHRDDVVATAFAPDGRTVLSGSSDTTARIWATDLPQVALHVPAKADTSSQPALTEDGRRMAFAQADGAVRLVDTTGGRTVATLPAQTGPVAGIVFSHDSRSALDVAGPGKDVRHATLLQLRLWDAHSGKVRAHITLPAPLQSATFSDDGMLVVATTMDGKARAWDSRTGRLRQTVSTRSGPALGVAAAHGLLVTSGPQRTAAVFSLASGKRLRLLPGHREPNTGFNDIGVTAIAISPDGTRIATGGVDGAVGIWNAATGKQRWIFAAHGDGRVTSLQFSPDGERLASGGSDGYVDEWRADNGVRIGRALSALNSAASFSEIQVAWSADGRDIATTGGLRARTFDTTGPSLRIVFDSLAGSATPGAHGRAYVNTGGDGVSILHCDLCGGPNDLLALAKRRATRPFSHAERIQYLHEKS